MGGLRTAAVVAMIALFHSVSHATTIVEVSPTVNDGSFESWNGNDSANVFWRMNENAGTTPDAGFLPSLPGPSVASNGSNFAYLQSPYNGSGYDTGNVEGDLGASGRPAMTPVSNVASVTLSFDWTSTLGPFRNTFVELVLWNSDQSVNADLKTNLYATGTGPADPDTFDPTVWQHFSITYTAADLGFTDIARLKLNFNVQGFGSVNLGSQAMYLDDVNLSFQTAGATVPEPTSLVLLGIGLLALVRFRKAARGISKGSVTA